MFSQSPPKYLIIGNERIIILKNVKQIINHYDEKIIIEFIDGTNTSVDGDFFEKVKEELFTNK